MNANKEEDLSIFILFTVILGILLGGTSPSWGGTGAVIGFAIAALLNTAISAPLLGFRSSVNGPTTESTTSLLKALWWTFVSASLTTVVATIAQTGLANDRSSGIVWKGIALFLGTLLGFINWWTIYPMTERRELS